MIPWIISIKITAFFFLYLAGLWQRCDSSWLCLFFMLLTNLTLSEKICIINTVLLVAILFVHAVDILWHSLTLESIATTVIYPLFPGLAFGCFVAGQALSWAFKLRCLFELFFELLLISVVSGCSCPFMCPRIYWHFSNSYGITW